MDTKQLTLFDGFVIGRYGIRNTKRMPQLVSGGKGDAVKAREKTDIFPLKCDRALSGGREREWPNVIKSQLFEFYYEL